MHDIMISDKNVALFALMAAVAFALVAASVSVVPIAAAQHAAVSSNPTASSPASFIPIGTKYCGFTCGYQGACPVGPSKSAGICEKNATTSCYSCVYQKISTSGAEYTVTFSETGLPSGATWSVTLNGVQESSSTSDISFQEYNGSYSYSIGSSGIFNPSPSSGSVSVSGSNTGVSVGYTSQSCLVNAPNGYCGFSACPSGYTCTGSSSPVYIVQIGSQCNIGNSNSGGYATGTCQPGQGTSNTTATPPAVGSCGYLPGYLANVLSTNENWYCPINYYTSTIWSKYLPLAIVAVLLAFLIAALIIMVGIAAKSDSIRNFGMGEFLEATASTVIVLTFLYISAVMFGLFPGSLVGPINPYATALHLISSTITSTQGIYNTLFSTYSTAAFYASMSTSIGVGGLSSVGAVTGSIIKIASGVTKQAYAGIITLLFIEPAQVLSAFLIDSTALLYAEYFLMVFFAVSAIPAFLVPGVIFRAILPTRALGGILIAMAMGFYIVMPTMFALAYYFTAPQLGQQLSILSATMNQFGSGTGSQTNALTPTSPLVTTITGVQSAMGSYWLLILFYPSLIIATTYFFIVQVSQFIGGAAYAGSRMRGFI